MAEKISINFHDIVGLDVLSDSKFVIDFYQNEYSSHLVQKLDEDTPRIKLYINQSSVPNISNHHYNAKHKLLARWNYIVQFSDNGIDIESTANHFGHIMLHHMVVHPCIRFLASNNNTLMLHAGAVTKNGGSIIITGKGGTGKTTTTSQLLAANPDISPHADDYVFLNTSNQSLAYITRSHLYSDLLKTIPGISERLTTREKIGVKVYSTIRKLSTDRIKWPTRVDQDRLWPNQDICKKAQIKAIIFLSRENIDQPRLIPNESISEFVDSLLAMNFSEAEHFIKLIKKQTGDEFLNKWISEWREKELSLLKVILENTPHFHLQLPSTIQAPMKLKNEVADLLLPLFS